jgi:ADP-heptose:LPS heptosyltransferase
MVRSKVGASLSTLGITLTSAFNMCYIAVMAFIDPNKIRKILIVRFGAFGDVLMTFPLLEALQELFPEASVDYAVFDSFRPLLEAAPVQPRRIIVLNRTKWRKMSPWSRLRDQVAYVTAVRRERYDLLIDPLSNTRSFFLSLMSGAACRVGIRHGLRRLVYHVAMREGERKYAAEVGLDLVRALGLKVPSRRPRMLLPAVDKAFAADFFHQQELEGRRVVLIHPTGTWPAKVWPRESFAKVARQLADSGHPV